VRLVKFGCCDLMVDHFETAVGRDHVDMVRFQLLPVRHLDHRHLCARREDARQFAAAIGVEVHDDNERRAGIRRYRGEKCLQGAYTARRGADGDYDRIIRTARRLRGLGIVGHLTVRWNRFRSIPTGPSAGNARQHQPMSRSQRNHMNPCGVAVVGAKYLP
jgi:hypothetical protein